MEIMKTNLFKKILLFLLITSIPGTGMINYSYAQEKQSSLGYVPENKSQSSKEFQEDELQKLLAMFGGEDFEEDESVYEWTEEDEREAIKLEKQAGQPGLADKILRTIHNSKTRFDKWWNTPETKKGYLRKTADYALEGSYALFRPFSYMKNQTANLVFAASKKYVYSKYPHLKKDSDGEVMANALASMPLAAFNIPFFNFGPWLSRKTERLSITAIVKMLRFVTDIDNDTCATVNGAELEKLLNELEENHTAQQIIARNLRELKADKNKIIYADKHDETKTTFDNRKDVLPKKETELKKQIQDLQKSTREKISKIRESLLKKILGDDRGTTLNEYYNTGKYYYEKTRIAYKLVDSATKSLSFAYQLSEYSQLSDDPKVIRSRGGLTQLMMFLDLADNGMDAFEYFTKLTNLDSQLADKDSKLQYISEWVSWIRLGLKLTTPIRTIIYQFAKAEYNEANMLAKKYNMTKRDRRFLILAMEKGKTKLVKKIKKKYGVIEENQSEDSVALEDILGAEHAEA